MNHLAKVMIVEDEAIIALAIQRQLTNAGFAVTGKAKTGAEALDQIEQERPDIVLMDIRLKGEMDGVQAAAAIRSRYALPVIYLSSHSDDETLARALTTEPFGYLTKPLANNNIRATIIMALRKHRTERELENSRGLLTTVFQGLPVAVLVAETSGEILFLNSAAEGMTGWQLEEAKGRSLFEVARIVHAEGHSDEPLLLSRQLVAEGQLVRLPANSTLIRRDGTRVAVNGQLSRTAAKAAGVLFLTMQDVTMQRREDQRIRQEQRMLVTGELAQGIGREFSGLFDLIGDAVHSLSGGDGREELDLIGRASKVGIGMSTHLLDLHAGNGAAHVVNVKEYLFSSQSLLQPLCGEHIRLQICSAPDIGYVLSTGDHFEQMIIHLILDGRQRLDGPGELTIGLDLNGDQVRLSLRAERLPGSEPLAVINLARAMAESVTFGMATPEQVPEHGLTIVRAIALAAGGTIQVSEPSDSVALIEVFLPRYESRICATTVTNEHARVILLVASESSLVESLKYDLGEEILVLDPRNLEEAAWISELYEGEISVVVVNEATFAPDRIASTCERIRRRRPGIRFLEDTCSGRDHDSPSELLELELRIEEVLHGNTEFLFGPGI